MSHLAAWRDRLTGSLAIRLILTSLLWSALALAGAGWLLVQLYTSSLIRSFDERIIVFEKTLAGVVADLQNLDVLLIGRLEHPAGPGQADDGGREGHAVFR